MHSGICYIFGAGEQCNPACLPEQDDLVIAADGGLQHLAGLGVRPHVIVGDFDSLGYVPEGDEVVRLPKEKDVTDTWAAIEIGIRRGYRRFHLFGCTGGRFEHTLANLQTAAHLAELGMACRIFSKTQVISAISGETMRFSADHKGFVSVFAHSDRCTGVTLRGLKYPLEDAELTNRFPLGVSNEFTGTESSITIGSGVAIVVFDRL